MKEIESESKKQEEKNKALEEELVIKKRNIQQLTAKLEEYVQAYPEFKPEKKKKPETEKQKKEDKNKKATSSNVAEEGDRSPTAQSKKTKNAVEHISRTASAIEGE